LFQATFLFLLLVLFLPEDLTPREEEYEEEEE